MACRQVRLAGVRHRNAERGLIQMLEWMRPSRTLFLDFLLALCFLSTLFGPRAVVALGDNLMTALASWNAGRAS